MSKRILTGLCLMLTLVLTLAACSPVSGDATASPAAIVTATAPTQAGTAAPSSAPDLYANIADADNVNEKGTFPIVRESITLDMALPINTKIEDIDTNKLTLWIEENSGIDLEFVDLSTTDTATQVNLMFTSGELPDVVWGYNFSYAAMCEYADAGYIAALDDCIAAYALNYYQFLEQVSVDNAEAYVTYNGHVYAVPTTTELVTNIYGAAAFRYQMLFTEALGLNEPTTLDEFYDMLVAFRDDDPNGNGKADEIPMTGYAAAGGKNVIKVLGNCYQYTDTSSYLKINDGVISFIAGNDLFKETVEYLKKLVDEKLLDPAIFTQDQATEMTTNIQDDVLVGVCADGYMFAAVYDTATEAFTSMEVLPALVGPYGYQATSVSLPGINRCMVMTTACETPGAAYRLMDMMLSEEAAVRARIGVEGEQWEQAPQGAVGRDGQQARFSLLTPQEWIQPTTNVIWDMESIVYSNVMNHVVDDREMFIRAAQKCSNVLSKTVTGEQLPNLIISVDDSAAYTDLQTLIVNYINENATLFILGDRSMDEWDDYLAELQAMGADEYVALAQAAYDAMQ